MKQAILSVVLICIALLAFGQGGGKSGAGGSSAASSTPSTTIIYNAKQSKVSPDFTAFPIDRPFTLEIDSIPTNGIHHILVFPVVKDKGLRKLYDDKEHRDKKNYRASFEIAGQDSSIGSNVITLRFPPLKAEMEFDVSIMKQVSPANSAKALNLNKSLYNIYGINADNDVKLLAKDKAKLDLIFNDLYQSVNGNSPYQEFKGNSFFLANNKGDPPDSKNIVYINNITDYKKYFYDPIKDYYKKLITDRPKKNPKVGSDTVIFWTHDFFKDRIITIVNSISKRSPVYNRLYILQKICDTPGLFNDIMMGKKQIDYIAINKSTDPYDFSKRVKNINAAYKFLDSLNNALVTLKAGSDPKAGQDINKNPYHVLNTMIDTTQLYLADLKHNSDLIDKYSKAITNQVVTNGNENIWVIGQSTASPDLTTLSSRTFAINAGVTLIGANDNSGTVNYIPKFFLGIDWHWKSFDKNADLGNLPDIIDTGRVSRSHLLEARPGFIYRWSLTLGLAFGSMGNKDFNNAYGSFSFTLGPSYAFGKYFKISAGPAVIDRYSNNPLLASTSRWLLCPYTSISVDYDLLNVVQGVTSSLFK